MPRLFRTPSVRIRAALVLTFCALLTNCASGTSSRPGAEAQLPPVVATVNDRPVSTKLYEMYLKNGREELGLDPATEDGRRKLEQLREGIVSELIDRTLIAQEAERRGISIPPEKMAEAVARTVRQFGGDEKYDAYLAAHHLTRDEYLEVVRMELSGELLRAELNKTLMVTDEEVGKYYEAHKSEPAFQQPERVTAAHILIAARPNLISQELERDKKLAGEALAAAVREEVERRRKLAEELRRRAAAGADFGALARQHSADPSSREQGGSLGTFARDTHARAFDEAAFSIKPGTVGPIVRTEFGFHVIKVSAREAARPQALAEATPEIRRRLLGEREAALLTQTLKEMRRRAKVRINEPFRFGALKDEFPSN